MVLVDKILGAVVAVVGMGLVEKVEHELHAQESVIEEFLSTGLGMMGFENVT